MHDDVMFPLMSYCRPGWAMLSPAVTASWLSIIRRQWSVNTWSQLLLCLS